MPQYPLGTITITKNAKKYLDQVIESKRLSYGPFCHKFEERFARLHDAKSAIVCSSGTAALHTILSALKIKHNWGDNAEVIVPAVTFVATINSVILSNLKPVLVDADPETYNIDPKLIEEKITSKTKAILPVHLFGKPAMMNEISSLAKKHNLLIIEDCCETLAAKQNGKTVGSWSEAAAFSTNSAHILATGIGGVITTNDRSLEQLMRSLINHGRHPTYLSIDDDNNQDSSDLKKLIKQRFLFDHVGFSYRLTEMEAAIGLAQLEKLPRIIKKRIENTQYLNNKLQPLAKWLQLPIIDKKPHVYMAYPLSLTKKSKKISANIYEKLVNYLEEREIETRPLMPLINQPAYKHLKINPKKYPVADKLLSSGFYVGCHQDLSQTDMDYFVDTLTKFFSSLS